jgi:hypothetical protein
MCLLSHGGARIRAVEVVCLQLVLRPHAQRKNDDRLFLKGKKTALSRYLLADTLERWLQRVGLPTLKGQLPCIGFGF